MCSFQQAASLSSSSLNFFLTENVAHILGPAEGKCLQCHSSSLVLPKTDSCVTADEAFMSFFGQMTDVCLIMSDLRALLASLFIPCLTTSIKQLL